MLFLFLANVFGIIFIYIIIYIYIISIIIYICIIITSVIYIIIIIIMIWTVRSERFDCNRLPVPLPLQPIFPPYGYADTCMVHTG